MLKISIITVVYNNDNYIEQTIRSVIEQTYSNIEYIVIDGGSTDNTLNIISKYKEYIDYFVSEPDRNMYEAINKGMKASTGDYICILNSDDYYTDRFVIENVAKSIEKYKNKYEGVYGNLYKVDAAGKLIRKRKLFQVNYLQLLLSRKLTFVGHASFFMSRKCMNAIGDYDCTRFSYACDYDYILRCFHKFKFKYTNIDIFCIRCHSNSITASGKLEEDTIKVLKKHNYYDISKLKRNISYYILWTKFVLTNTTNIIKSKNKKGLMKILNEKQK